MSQNWIAAITVSEWNSILENSNNFSSLHKLGENDLICFYVLGTSSIKGIAQRKTDGLLKFSKIGDVNFFSISERLGFVKDKEKVVKYLKNFHGFANLGKSMSLDDMETIMSSITTQESSQAKVAESHTILVSKNKKDGTPYETMFNLENSMREFVDKQLSSISKNWIKEKVTDPKMVEGWKNRMEDYDKRKTTETKDVKLIEFSDFYDLVTLIVNRGNWKACFEKYFGNVGVIQAKMYELIPVRNDIAHNRNISEDDIMMLNLYSKQILRMINNEN